MNLCVPYLPLLFRNVFPPRIVHLEEAKGKKTPTPAKKAATPARKTPGAGKADPAPASEAKKKGGKPPGPAPALAATKKRRRAASPIADANKEPAEEPAPQPVAKKARGAKGAAPAPAPAARGKRAAAPAPPSPARGAGAGSLRKSRRTPVKSSKAREQRDAERTVERILVEEEAERAAAAAAALKKAARTGTKKGGPGAGAVTPARRGVKLEEELGKARRRPGRPRKGEEQKLKTKGAAAGLKKTPASTMRQQRLLTRSVPRSSRGRAIRKRDLGEDFVDVESGESEQEE